jgi:hypothetical protein
MSSRALCTSPIIVANVVRFSSTAQNIKNPVVKTVVKDDEAGIWSRVRYVFRKNVHQSHEAEDSHDENYLNIRPLAADSSCNRRNDGTHSNQKVESVPPVSEIHDKSIPAKQWKD